MPIAPLAPPPALGDPPAEVDEMLSKLEGGVDAVVPRKRGGNLLIGTWNVRAFGGLTPKWESGSGDTPKRDLADACAIAEIIRRFDVVAVQEVRDNLAALRAVMARLGRDWAFITTDVGEGEPANGERLAFVYDRRRVTASGLAGELVVPEEWFGDIKRGALQRQFARTPYAVSFERGGEAFTLVTLHILYGDDAADRTPELSAIAVWLKERAAKGDDFNRNMIALGDFNIDRRDDPNWTAFTSEGLSPPLELYEQPRTIFDTPREKHFYDQIAWFTSGTAEQLTLGYTGHADHFDWTPFVHPGMDKTAKSWRISDHYPLWCEFEVGARRRRFRR